MSEEEPKPERWMTLLEYAAHRKLSRQRIDMLVREGRFNGETKTSSIGRLLLNQPACDEILKATERFRKKREPEGDDSVSEESTKKTRKKNAGASPDEENFENSTIELNHFKAKLARQKYETEAGLLISIEKVQQQTYEMARAVRDSLLELPDRLSSWLAAQRDERKIAIRLDEEIRQALERVTKIIEQAEENDISKQRSEDEAEEKSLQELSRGS